uniref:Uncharacterized protein n=1 Tax=Anguilla anguilla TaxID=7936 RepID=A0A0E9XX68_ANGAN
MKNRTKWITHHLNLLKQLKDEVVSSFLCKSLNNIENPF